MGKGKATEIKESDSKLIEIAKHKEKAARAKKIEGLKTAFRKQVAQINHNFKLARKEAMVNQAKLRTKAKTQLKNFVKTHKKVLEAAKTSTNPDTVDDEVAAKKRKYGLEADIRDAPKRTTDLIKQLRKKKENDIRIAKQQRDDNIRNAKKQSKQRFHDEKTTIKSPTRPNSLM